MNVVFTKFTSKESLSKRYWFEGNAIHKKAAAQMTHGEAERVTMPFPKFAEALSCANDKQSFGYGTSSFNFADKVKIVTKSKEQPDKNIISRTQDYFKYPEGAGILMLDHDPSDYGKTFTPDELMAVLTAIDPTIALAARIIRGSVSAGVHLVGEQPKAGKGFHVYVAVANAADVPRYGKLLFDRLWLAGHGYIALSASGATLLRTPIDAAVFSPERLDFVGKPIISGTGLQFTPPAITYTEGGYLDTKSLPDLIADELQTLAKIQAEAKAAIKPKSEAVQSDWATAKVTAMQSTGVDTATAKTIVNRILKGGCQDLYGDFILEFAEGSVSVADVLKNPQLYNGKALADPIEGIGYGSTTAKFYWNDGKPVINSLAHGQDARYFLHNDIKKTEVSTPSWEIELTEHVTNFNKTHASVVIGGKHKILRANVGGSTGNDRTSYEYFSRKELELLHDHTTIKIGVKKTKFEEKDIYANHLIAWAKHPDARTFTGGVVFLPGGRTDDNFFNTWRSFAVNPVQNDVLLQPIYDHITKIVCGDDVELIEYFLNWVAYSVQHLDKPAGSALVLRGKKGCGKGTIGHFLKKMWGDHGLHISNPLHLVGNFNAHLADTCFLFSDEAFFSRDKKHEGVLKAIITEPVLTIERKGFDVTSQPNYLKVFMATNDDFAVPATGDERRFCIFDVKPDRIGDTEYFKKLHDACASKTVQAAFLYAMQQRDISQYHAGRIPETIGLKEQRYHSLDTAGQWLVDALMDGSFSGKGWFTSLTSQELYASYVAWCDLIKASEYRRFTQCKLGRYLGEMFDSVKVPIQDGIWPRGYQFGELAEAIATFEAYEKISLAALRTTPLKNSIGSKQ